MTISEFFLDLLFPRACISCRTRIKNGVICETCSTKVSHHTNLFCGSCRARLPGISKICHKDFPYLAGAAADYADPVVKDLLHALKFEHAKDAAEPLGKLVSNFALHIPLEWSAYTLVPIPLSKKRERERGYNQSELIAKIASHELGISLRTDFLVRNKHTQEQSKVKGHKERMTNVAGVFTITPSLQELPSHIVLIDDVTTSGATLLSAAQVLKAAGVKKIIALTVARA